MVLIISLLYPFPCENYSTERHGVLKQQITIAGKRAPHLDTTTQYHYYNQYWNKLLELKSCKVVCDHFTYPEFSI